MIPSPRKEAWRKPSAKSASITAQGLHPSSSATSLNLSPPSGEIELRKYIFPSACPRYIYIVASIVFLVASLLTALWIRSS